MKFYGSFEALKKLFQDFKISNKLFGGRAVLCGRDFYKILAVVSNGMRTDIVINH